MGNQGMTNWKFTAFLTIALMLVAGMFSSTAMAAANDGQGTISLAVTVGDNFQAAADPLPQILLAGEEGYTLTFTYTVGDDAGPLGAIDMNGGMVEIAIPGEGWKVPKANVTVTDGGDTLIATDADGADALKRIVFTGGDDLTKIGVKLDADWNVAADASTSLTIAITGVTTGTPNSLYVPQDGRPYREYTFRTRTMAKDGSLRSLVIGADGANPQPIARVGNVGDGKGQVDVSLVVYEAETARNIELVFTAAGPMYDSNTATGTAVDAAITITAPTGLTAPQITDPAGAGYVTVSRQSGTVLFERPNQKIDDPSGQTITIDIARMEKGAKIYVAYRKVDAPAIGAATAAPFTAQSLSTSALAAVTVKPDGNHLRAVAGSGEIKLTRGEVVSAGTKPTLTFTYKAATKLTDAALVIDQPDGGGWTDLVLQSGDSRADNYVSFSGGDSGTALDLDPVTAENQNVSGSAGQAITVTNVTLNASASVTVTITRITLTGAAGTDPLDPVDNGVYAWPSTLNADTDILADPMLYVVGDARASVAFAIIPTADADHATATATALPHYNAASKENIRFRFTTTTPIKGGYVQFNIPSGNGWAQPSKTDVKGKATVKLVGWDSTASEVTLDTPADDADMTLTVSNYMIKVNIVKFAGGAITVQYGIGTGDNQGMVGNRAVDNLEIVGRFNTGSSSGAHPAAAPISVRIGNVAAGSGTAMITTPSTHTVEAGSDDNTIQIVYRAAGTMTGGSVRLQSPENWGTLQETDSAADNHIRVEPSSSINQADISYGPRYVFVPLGNVQANDAVTFVLSNVKAQPTIGLAEFRLESAGGPSDSLMRLMGEPLLKDADDKDIVDRYMLLGKVYVPRFAEGGAIPERIGAVATADDVTNDTGILRLEVVAGAGGTGEAKLDRVARSDAGLRNYLNEARDAIVSERRVHAGDEEIYLVFKYTPVQTITDGALRFTVPTDWTEPQEDSSNTIGYTTVLPSGANIGALMFENRVVTIPIVDITSADSIEIHYGSGSFGATAPKTRQVGDAASDFLFAVKGTAGTFSNIGAAPVNVYSQASGEGSASAMAENATAGHPEGSIKITYDPEGQIVNGRVKLTVDAALTGGADGDGVMSTSGITPSSGSAMYGGDPSMTDDSRTMYGITKNDILVSGVSLGADDEFTFTYSGMMPVAKGDLSFTVAVDGGEGPGETVPPAMPAPMQVGDPVTVTVMDAAAGSGGVVISQMNAAGDIVDVVAGMGGYTIKFTYTAIGEIGEGKTITVDVPDNWSPPLNEAAADEKMGTFTAMHYLKLADDDADGMPNMGDAVAASVTTEEVAVAGQEAPVPMTMVATVASGKMVKEGDMVVFTYSNAMAPAMPERSVFTTEYDGMMVGGDNTVVVNSTTGVSKVALESANSFVKEVGSLTVTAKLVDEDGMPATRSMPTKVTFMSSSSTGSFNPPEIDIDAGDYMGTSEYSDTEAGNVMLSASTTATGVAGSGDMPVLVDTNDPTINADSITAEPMYAKAGTMVTVSATGTAARAAGTVLFSVSSGVVTEGQMTEGEAGSYSGTFTVGDLHAEGTHDVTVHIEGTEATATAEDALTIDTTLPEVTDASADMSSVMMGDSVTISAMLSEAATVEADVSGLNADAPMLSLMDADGDGEGMMYSGTVMVTGDGNADVTITITASDAAGNEAMAATVMVTLDNTMPRITDASADMSSVMMGDSVTISAMLSEAATVNADVSGLNADAPMLSLMDADGDGEGMMYSGTVMVTGDGNADVTITITASDDADNAAEPAMVMVTLDNTVPTITDASADMSSVMTGASVTISAMLSEDADVSADVSGLNADAPMLSLMDADGDGEGMMYSGTVMVAAEGDAEVTITISASDDAGNAADDAMVMVTLDNTVPTVTASDVDGKVRNGQEVTISAEASDDGSGVDSVMADLSNLDTAADPAEVELMDDDSDGTYTYTHTISEDNEADNGTHAVTVTVTDMAGNTASDDAMVTLQNTLFYTSTLEGGTVTLFHLPLAVEGISTVGELKTELGGDDNVSLLAAVVNGAWDFAGDDMAIAADLGLLVNVRADTTVEFEGRPWDEGASMINLRGGGLNLVGLPLDVEGVDNVSDIMGLSDAVTSIIVLSEGEYQLVAAAGDPGDDAVAGDAAYLISASTDATIDVMGEGWSNEPEAGAAPIALAGYKVDSQTPALAVYGSVIDEITGLAREGFRVKVKNLSTKAALSEVTSAETADGYDMIFVDLTDAHAARVGDVLEISADSPDPLVGVKPVRHIVTADDVKNSTIQLENLIAYEIPAETELLRNYPNPFNPETWIPYHLSEDADVKLTIYDISGEVVRDIDVGHQTAAKYDTRSKAIYWDGRNRFGEQVASGIYFYHLQAGDFSGTRKMVILK